MLNPGADLAAGPRRPAWLLALGVAASLLLLSVGAWWWLAEQREDEARRAALDRTWLEQSLAQTLQINERMLSNWAHDLGTPSEAAAAEFQTRIAGLMKDNPALLAVEPIDRQGARQGGLPLYRERPAQLPPLSDPLIQSAVVRALTLEQPVYSQVIEQGGALWVLAVPVPGEPGAAPAALLATYDLDRLLEQEVPWWFVQRYDLSLVDRHYKRLAPRDGHAPASQEAVHRIGFGPEAGGLALWVAPHEPGQGQRLLALLAGAALLFALAVLWLLWVLYRWLRERQAAQRALSASREQLRAVLAGLESAVSVSALADGRLLFRNRHHETVFACAAEAPCCLLPPWGRPLDAELRALDCFDPALQRWYHLERRSMQWVDGSTVLLDIATDISAERQAADTARERDDLLQHTARLSSLAEFASGIAHELNQPLAALANYVAVADSLLTQSPAPLPRIEDAVRRAGEEARRAGQIIQSLRNFIHKRRVEVRSHELSALLAEPLALLAPLAQRLQVVPRVLPPAEPARLDCDGVMMEQVLFNLLRNALEALATLEQMPAADALVLEIRAEPGEPELQVSVADRGPGVSRPDQLFQAFYTTKGEGMGLGLAICRTVIEGHGGRLWAEPNPGGGARFCFRLPRSARQGDILLSEPLTCTATLPT
ncbi:hypothetical protein G8A07_06450 [Roseateles sp. DAIF2]|uniref:sensor histidine kinase n=1 Tax=Roseateles sp. DAIF2 TaxID=2714952 RepID=UPI0018A2C507|nr:sensor histidine kinase [Roseateles sp. DAIF2]QPF72604.1 hypothetical protein G8A07_06450 [Roseateles sp. DAIF2]